MKETPAARPLSAQASYRVEKLLLLTLSLLALALFIYSPKVYISSVSALFAPEGIRQETVLESVNEDDHLLFASTDVMGIASAKIPSASDSNSSADDLQVLVGEFPSSTDVKAMEDANKTFVDGETIGHGGPEKVSGMFPSPDGKYVAVEYDFVSRPHVRILDLSSRAEPKLRDLVPEGWGFFLDWHPDGKSVLIATIDQDISDPGLWLVNVEDGSHARIETPGLKGTHGVLSADFSPDGETIAYSISNGLGFGSEVWSVSKSGENQRKLLVEESTTISEVDWSPDGSQIAFVKLLDSPIAFAEAGIWLMSKEGINTRPLALMDGGQGQKPVWSSDGQRLFFVGRDNPDDLDANYDDKLTTTSIRSIGLEDKEARILVPSDGARHLDLTIDEDGTLLFVSNRGGALEVWSATQTGDLTQLTNDGADKRYSVVLKSTD